MENEKCKITLNSPANIYFSGQQIKGQICLFIKKTTKLRGIKFKITGIGKCRWIQLLPGETGSSLRGNNRRVIYGGKEHYLLREFYIFGSKNERPVQLDPGEHSFAFTFDLRDDLPSSFNGSHGSIKYKIKFTVEKAWNFDEIYKCPITIVRQRLVPIEERNRPGELRQTTRNIGVFGGGPISLVAELPKFYALRDKDMKLLVTVDNHSGTHIDKLKFSILQFVLYVSQTPFGVKRFEVNKIFKKETGGIQKKTERTFAYDLHVPPCQPTDSAITERIISIYYEVQIDVVLPGLYNNLTVNIPFEVITGEEAPGNPFETSAGGGRSEGIGWTFFPSVNNVSVISNSSIESPSHSSFYSDLGSIHSTTSDSSIATLSPAPTQFEDYLEPPPPVPFMRNGTTNTPGAIRSSVRSSIGLRMSSNSNSPLSLNSLPEYNQSMVPSQPLPAVRGINHGELPPSYDDIFGPTRQIDTTSSATAPPLETV